MVDIAQPVSNLIIFSSIAVVMGFTLLGIAAVYIKKNINLKRSIRDNA